MVLRCREWTYPLSNLASSPALSQRSVEQNWQSSNLHCKCHEWITGTQKGDTHTHNGRNGCSEALCTLWNIKWIARGCCRLFRGKQHVTMACRAKNTCKTLLNIMFLMTWCFEECLRNEGFLSMPCPFQKLLCITVSPVKDFLQWS